VTKLVETFKTFNRFILQGLAMCEKIAKAILGHRSDATGVDTRTMPHCAVQGWLTLTGLRHGPRLHRPLL
jgi:hypothetical protein